MRSASCSEKNCSKWLARSVRSARRSARSSISSSEAPRADAADSSASAASCSVSTSARPGTLDRTKLRSETPPAMARSWGR